MRLNQNCYWLNTIKLLSWDHELIIFLISRQLFPRWVSRFPPTPRSLAVPNLQAMGGKPWRIIPGATHIISLMFHFDNYSKSATSMEGGLGNLGPGWTTSSCNNSTMKRVTQVWVLLSYKDPMSLPFPKSPRANGADFHNTASVPCPLLFVGDTAETG